MNKNTVRQRNPVRRGLLILLSVMVVAGWYGGIAYGMAHRRGILDWAILLNYKAPSTIADIATQDTMTPAARRILYVTDPKIEASDAFANSCASVKHQEKTIVLGCYVGNQSGIYVLQVTDSRLDGVEQVTTAHEMLHAAYGRLSSAERTKVDAELEDYYEHDLTDRRIKDTIAAYKVSEPNDVVNEMHSVFGTEVAQLPAPLEQYYKQYFTDRSQVAAYAAKYQAEFTSRQDQVAAYDAQLSALKQQITADNNDLDTKQTNLDNSKAQLDSYRANNQIAAYNAAVPAYNAQVNAFNAEIETVKSLINQYNALVATRNALVLEEQQLTNELSGSSVPSSV